MDVWYEFMVGKNLLAGENKTSIKRRDWMGKKHDSIATGNSSDSKKVKDMVGSS